MIPAQVFFCKFGKILELKDELKHKEIRLKKRIVERCLLIPDLNPVRSQVKGNHSIGRVSESIFF